jgi:iron complex outermembrane receptor protein
VSAERIFKKETAGMKETRVDTLVLMEKLNQSLSGVLSGNTSVFIKNHGRGALATASFRGTAASHTEVMWNGISMSSPMSGIVDFSLIPVYIIDDLNLKHGGASIADRSGGLGGSINIENSVQWNKPFQFKYMQGIGSYSTFDEFLMVGWGTKKFQAKTRLYHNYSANDYTFINRGIRNIDPVTKEQTSPLDTNDNAGYFKYGLLQELYFRPNTLNVLSLKYWGQFADRTIPRATSYEGPDNANRNNQTDEDHKLVLDWKRYSDQWKWTARTGITHKKLDYIMENLVVSQGLQAAVFSKSRETSSLNQLKTTYTFNNTLSFDGALDANFYSVSSIDTVKKSGYDKKRTEFSLYLAMHKSFMERLNINLMLRQDWKEGDLLPFIPFVGFDYKVVRDKNLLVKGSVSRNYKYPSINDLYWQPGGNPDLKPEDGVSGELGLEWKRALGSCAIGAECTAYYSDIKNWIIWIPSFKGYWEPQNIKRVESMGLELTLKFDGALGRFKYKINGIYALTKSINYGDRSIWGDESYGKQLVYVPVHSGNVFAKIWYKEFYLSYLYNAYSERFTTSSNETSRRDALYPYHMNDLSLGTEFVLLKKYTAGAELKVYNLFNETYHSVLYRPMPKINCMLQLMIKF